MAKKDTTASETPKPQPEPDPPAEPPNDIDARMAALLKDHQRMGARPK